MKAERFKELMEGDDLCLSADEIAQNWHFCNEFDGLLMRNESGLMNFEGTECICRYVFPNPGLKET